MLAPNFSMTLLAIPLAAYFLGSIPFGLILTRVFGGGDVRGVGSGNIGATNVVRAAGLSAGLFSLLLGAAKGAGAGLLAETPSNDSAPWVISAIAAPGGPCFSGWL